MPRYITENNNGDIVVTDFDIGPGAVVVTNENGSHRFSFTGHPSGSELLAPPLPQKKENKKYVEA